MGFCPFMSDSKNVLEQKICATTCELRVNNTCALKILAQKAIFDARQQKQSNAVNNDGNIANGTA